MKLFGNFLFVFFLLLCYYSSSQAQQVTIYESGKVSIVRYINSNNQYDYTWNVVHQIGRDDGNNGIRTASTEDIWRTEHSFNLSSIPSNANITQAQILIFIGGIQCSTCSLKVTKTTGSQQWTDINNTNLIISNVSYSNTSVQLASTELKTAINDRRSSGTLYLGSLSQNENTNLTYASIELRLIVDYTIPVSNVTFTADNNFVNTGGANHGTMSIDG